MSVDGSDAVEQPKSGYAWKWVLGVVALGLVAHGVLPQADGVNNFAYSIGFWLIPLVLFTLVFCAIFKASREYRYQVFVIAYGSALVGSLIGSAILRVEANKAMGGMRESFVSFTDQVNTDPNAPVKPIEMQPVTATASGDMGIMEVVTKQLLNDAALMQNAYLKALDEAGWPKILDVERLKQDPTLKESRAIVAAAKEVMQEYRAKSLAIFDSLPERVTNAPFKSESNRRQFLKGAETGRINGRINTVKNWEFEEGIINGYAGVIEVFAQAKGKFQFDAENNVLFESDADAEAFNRHMSQVQTIIEQQSQHMTSIRDAALKKFDSAMK